MTIPFDIFKQVELRVATILAAEAVEGSEKLVKLQVDIGTEKRQILAGIAKMYPPEQLVGRQIIIVANLEPRVLMGLESQGMLLAASGEEGPVLLKPDSEVPPGTEIR
jgi:methionine--tRNA ligase beta chain